MRGEAFKFKLLGTELMMRMEKKLIIACCRITRRMES